MTDQIRRQICVGAAVAATVIVDGTVAATWSASSADDAAVLTVQLLRPLSPADRSAIETEADRLLAFTNPATIQRDVWIL